MKYLPIALLALALAPHAGAQPQAHAPRDPFARPVMPAPAPVLEAEMAAEQPAEQPHLRAIMVTPGHALANVSGQILAEGDRFGDYRVAKIRERSVTLVKRGVKSELGLDEAGGK